MENEEIKTEEVKEEVLDVIGEEGEEEVVDAVTEATPGEVL